MSDGERYRFLVEWLDPLNKLKKEFVLTYYTADGSLEMYDCQLRRAFLKRMKCDNIKVNDLYLGSMVNILSRQLFITDYADKKTEQVFAKALNVTVFIVKEEGFHALGTIIDSLYSNGLFINKGRMEKIRDNNNYIESTFSKNLGEKFAVFEIRGQNSMDVLMQLLGLETMISIEIKVSLGNLKEFCLTPTSEEACKFELEIFFPKGKEIYCNTMVVNDSTACIIKPHAVENGMAGKIIQDIIQGGFIITAFHFLNFDLSNATEFYEVYKGVVSFYNDMICQLISGPCIALEIRKQNTNTIVEDFRKLVGPNDPLVAKMLRPTTLRAVYGEDDIQNAVHCTDLPEDGKIDVEYLFYIMTS